MAPEKVILWIILVGLALFIIGMLMTKRQNAKNYLENSDEESTDNTYMTEGGAVGMCLGTAVGLMLESLAIGVGLGLVLGMVVGMNYKKP